MEGNDAGKTAKKSSPKEKTQSSTSSASDGSSSTASVNPSASDSSSAGSSSSTVAASTVAGSSSAGSSSSNSASTSSSSVSSSKSSGSHHPPNKKIKMDEAPTSMRDWNPTAHGAKVVDGGTAMSRIKKDLQEFSRDPPEGISLCVNDANISQLDVLIVGPKDTPYQGGFFHFYLSFDNQYPFKPPRVKLMTTGNGKVRFNPNFYSSGKVCLSILGTWTGPQWNASQTLSSVLIAIQSLMSEDPYRNEPGFEKMKASDVKAVDYCHIIRHETLRVAVCDTIEGKTRCPQQLVDRVVKPTFLKNFETYLSYAGKLESESGNVERGLFRKFLDRFRAKENSDREPVCMFGENRGPFDMSQVRSRLVELQTKLTSESEQNQEDRGSESDVQVIPDPSAKRASWMEEESRSPENDEGWDDIFADDDDVSELSDYQEDEDENDDDEVDSGTDDVNGSVRRGDAAATRRDKNNEDEDEQDAANDATKDASKDARRAPQRGEGDQSTTTSNRVN